MSDVKIRRFVAGDDGLDQLVRLELTLSQKTTRLLEAQLLVTHEEISGFLPARTTGVADVAGRGRPDTILLRAQSSMTPRSWR